MHPSGFSLVSLALQAPISAVPFSILLHIHVSSLTYRPMSFLNASPVGVLILPPLPRCAVLLLRHTPHYGVRSAIRSVACSKTPSALPPCFWILVQHVFLLLIPLHFRPTLIPLLRLLPGVARKIHPIFPGFGCSTATPLHLPEPLTTHRPMSLSDSRHFEQSLCLSRLRSEPT